MMTDQQQRGLRIFSGVVRLVVSAICLVWIGFILISAPWERGGGFLAGSLAIGIVPLGLVCALLPDGIRQVFGRGGK